MIGKVLVLLCLFYVGVTSSFSLNSGQLLSAVNERNLGILDFMNSILRDIDIDLNGQGRCDSFEIGSIIVETSEVFAIPEGELIFLNIKLRGIKIKCEVSGDTFLEVPVQSDDSSFDLGLEIISNKFSRVIPNEARLRSTFTCSSAIDLELSLIGNDFFLFNPIRNLISSIVEGVINGRCEEITGALENALLLVGNNTFIDLIGERLEQPDSIYDLLQVEEQILLQNLPQNFEFLTANQLDSTVSALLENVVNSDLGQAIIVPALDGDISAAFDEIIDFLGELNITLDSNILLIAQNLVSNELIVKIINDVLSGEFSIPDVLGFFNLPIPSITELLSVFPDEILNFLDSIGLLERIELVLGFILPETSISGVDENGQINLGFTVSTLIGFFPEENEITAFLLEKFTNDTPLIEVLNYFFNDLTVGEVFVLIPSGFGELLLEVFGADLVVFQIIVNLTDSITQALNNLFGDFDISSDEPIPSILIPILEIVQTFRPDLEQFEFIDGTTTLGELLALFPLVFNIGLFGDVELTFTRFILDLEFALSNFDLAPDFGSIVLPKFEIKDGSFITFEFAVTITNLDVVLYNDVISFTFDFDIETQEAVILAANYNDLQNFDFISLASAEAIDSISTDLPDCALGSVGGGLSSQKALANFLATASFLLEDDIFLVNALNIALDLYSPALPTLLENTITNFFTESSGNLFKVNEEPEACVRDFVAPVPDPSDDDDETTPEGPIGTVGAAEDDSDISTILLVIAIIGFFVLLIAGYAFVGGKQKKESDARALLETDSRRPVRPKAEVVALAKPEPTARKSARPSRPKNSVVNAAKTELTQQQPKAKSKAPTPGSFQQVKILSADEIDF